MAKLMQKIWRFKGLWQYGGRLAGDSAGFRQNLLVLPVLLLFGLAGLPLAAAQGVSSLKKHDVNQPIDITADELEVQTKDNMATFRGHVDAIQDDLHLKADRVAVYYREQPGASLPNSGAAISRIDASGNVVLMSPSETAHSKWGIYDLDKKIITLGGSVNMVKDNNNIQGDRLQLDLVSGITRIEGSNGKDVDQRVRGRFVPPPAKTDGK